MNQWNICCIKGRLSVKFVHWASHEESTSPGEKRDGSHAVSSWQILALQDHTQIKHIYTLRNYYMEFLRHPCSFLLVVGGFSKIYICRIFQRSRVVSKFVNYLMDCSVKEDTRTTKIVTNIEVNHMWRNAEWVYGNYCDTNCGISEGYDYLNEIPPLLIWFIQLK